MRRFRPSQSGRVILLAGFASAGAACTLASGWSDLQNGSTAKDGGPTPDGTTESDTGVPAVDASFDRSAVDTGALTKTTEKCGGFDCTATETCCFDPGFGKSCDTPAACEAAGGWAFGCQSKAGCATGSCCFDYNSLSATCQPTCNITSVILCDPAKSDCPNGQKCTRTVGNSDSKACQ